MVELLDSTLREGEQTPGVLFTRQDKLEIAHALDAFGVDYIEVGHPQVSPDIAAACRDLCAAGLSAQTVVHARALRADIDAAIDCGADWVGIFYCVREEALQQRFGRDLEAVAAQVADVVAYAKDHGLRVRYTPEDTVRSPWPNVERVARAAVAAGADRLSIADTTGCMTPARTAEAVRRMLSIVDVPVHFHGHNDLGLAAANALAAVEAGARVVDVTVNGLGERTGIADLATVATALRVAHGVGGYDLTCLPHLAALVARRSGIGIPPQAPLVGANAFTHNAGLHVQAVFHDPSHYESVPADLVGRRRSVCIDRFAGLPTLRYKCRELGIEADEETLRHALRRIKDAELNRVDDATFLALVGARPGVERQAVRIRAPAAVPPPAA